MTEAELNRLLRRVDWRFLLPTSQPEKSICFTDGVLAEAVRLVSATSLDAKAPIVAECDLAVARDPPQKCIQAAWAHLRAGGSIYFEFYPPRRSGVEAISQYLERLGFEDIVWYQPWPSAETPEYWIPSNSIAARRYIRVIRTLSTSLLGRLRQRAAHVKWAARLRFTRTLPVCVIARKPPKISGDILEQVLEIAGSASEFQRPRQVSQLLMTGGTRSINKIVRLLFEEPRPDPFLATKTARVSASCRALAKEASNLEYVRSLSTGNLSGVPELRFKGVVGGAFTLAETAFVGIPIFARVARSNYRAFAIQATDWLIAFAGKPRRRARHLWWGRLVEPIFNEFDRSYGSVADQQARQMSEQIICELPALPLVCEQRDFSPWNLLLKRDGELAVLDWESAEPEGLPGMDLIYFLTYLGFSLDGARDRGGYCRSYRAGLDTTSLTGAVNSECLQRYAYALGFSVGHFHPLRLLTWMLHSRSEYRQLVADVGGEPTSEALDNSFFLSLWRQELGARTYK